MNKAERRLADDRGLRGKARGLFDTRLAQVKADLSARSVPARIKAKATDEAANAIEHGLDVAKQSKGVIAITAGALALWFFRAPLLGLFAKGKVQDEPVSGDAEPAGEQSQ